MPNKISNKLGDDDVSEGGVQRTEKNVFRTLFGKSMGEGTVGLSPTECFYISRSYL
jgi:hypothetical protein